MNTKVWEIINRKIDAEIEARRPLLQEQYMAARSRMAERGMLRSSIAVREVTDVCINELNARGQVCWRIILDSLEKTGSPFDPEIANQAKDLLETKVPEGLPDLKHYINDSAMGRQNSGITDQIKGMLDNARANLFERLNAEIDLETLSAESRSGVADSSSVNLRGEEAVEDLILGGESELVEFKSTLRYDLQQQMVNKKLEFVVAKTISAFLNSSGGNLIIGVDDDCKGLGLQNDISTLKKQNIDGFELQLIEVIKKYVGAEFSSLLNISFPEHDNQRICQVSVSPSSSPVFVTFEGKEDFFVRSGCSSQPLSREEQSAYEREKWG